MSDTAFWIAHLRAAETQRPDALFSDPFADRLAGERGREMAAGMPMSRMIAWSVGVRTCIVDDYINTALRDGVDAVLNLGAGLDARPYRMQIPQSLRWIEADYPQIIEHKERCLSDAKPVCVVERVGIDLAHRVERRSFLARIDASARKLLVLTEGVVPYLSNDEAAALADDLRATKNTRYWILDYFSADADRFRQRSGMTRLMHNAPFKFAPGDWFAFFRTHGWAVSEMRYLVDEGELLGRPLPLRPWSRWMMKIATTFAPPEKRAALRNFSGYALLVPTAEITAASRDAAEPSPLRD